MPHMLPYIGLCVALVGFVAAAIYSQRKAVKLTAEGWNDLLARIERVDVAGMAAVAQDYLNPQANQTKFEPEEMWTLVGGHEGLDHMRTNAELMLALVAHARQWNPSEAAIVGERMRGDALRLRKAVTQIELGMMRFAVLKRVSVFTPFHLQEAVGAYYLMRQRLLVLCEASHSGRYPALAAAL